MTNPSDSLQVYDTIVHKVRADPPPLSVFKGYPKPTMDEICCSTGLCVVWALHKRLGSRSDQVLGAQGLDSCVPSAAHGTCLLQRRPMRVWRRCLRHRAQAAGFSTPHPGAAMLLLLCVLQPRSSRCGRGARRGRSGCNALCCG